MIHLLWPWMLALLPLPWLVRRLVPVSHARGAAIRVPFFQLLAEGDGSGAYRSPRIRSFTALLAWALLLLAAARPVWLDPQRPLATTGRDLMLLVDISGSMRAMDLGRDEAPMDRLTAVKQVAGRFLEERAGDRLGLILFGARPYLRAPLTFDRTAVKGLLEEAEIALAGEFTAIGDAIGLAVKRLRGLEAETRVVVLLTDGANNRGQVSPRQAAALAAQYGVRIYTIGVGRPEGAAPNPYGSWSASGAAQFEREVLEAVAERTGGRYFHVLDATALVAAYAELDRLEPALGTDPRVYGARSLYPWPLGAALLLATLLVARTGQRAR